MSGSPRERAQVIGKYALFQIPGIALAGLALYGAVRWLGVPESAAWVLLGLWVVKDVVMFRFVRLAYESGDQGGVAALVGAVGISKETLDPGGYVQIGHEAWRAHVPSDHAPVPAGARVRVLAVEGLTVLVEPH